MRYYFFLLFFLAFCSLNQKSDSKFSIQRSEDSRGFKVFEISQESCRIVWKKEYVKSDRNVFNLSIQEKCSEDLKKKAHKALAKEFKKDLKKEPLKLKNIYFTDSYKRNLKAQECLREAALKSHEWKKAVDQKQYAQYNSLVIALLNKAECLKGTTGFFKEELSVDFKVVGLEKVMTAPMDPAETSTVKYPYSFGWLTFGQAEQQAR